MPASDFKKLNLPLPLEMHKALFSESKDLGVPATRLVRSVLEDWLRERRRVRRREAIQQFATAHAGTELDLDADLAAAAGEALERFYEGDGEAG